MSNQPSTPVKIPSSAATYTAGTLDPDLRSEINTLLLRDDHVNKIQESLLHSLHSHTSNWPTMVQSHALSLLRSGECTTFPALLKRVLEDIRQDTAAAVGATTAGGASSTPSKSAITAPSKPVNGATDVNGTATTKTNGDVTASSSEPEHSLAIPQAVVEEALRTTRESLEAVCEIDQNGVS